MLLSLNSSKSAPDTKSMPSTLSSMMWLFSSIDDRQRVVNSSSQGSWPAALRKCRSEVMGHLGMPRLGH